MANVNQVKDIHSCAVYKKCPHHATDSCCSQKPKKTEHTCPCQNTSICVMKTTRGQSYMCKEIVFTALRVFLSKSSAKDFHGYTSY